MFKCRHNPELQNVKFETTSAAIERGVNVQTEFWSKAELKEEIELKEIKYEKVADNYSADSYKQLKLIGAI